MLSNLQQAIFDQFIKLVFIIFGTCGGNRDEYKFEEQQDSYSHKKSQRVIIFIFTENEFWRHVKRFTIEFPLFDVNECDSENQMEYIYDWKKKSVSLKIIFVKR